MDAGCSIISSISPTPSSVIGRGHVLTGLLFDLGNQGVLASPHCRPRKASQAKRWGKLRSDAEKYKIGIEANRRRENISASSGDDVSDWLEAEAFLQASGEITRRPIALPFELLFTSVDITAPQPRAAAFGGNRDREQRVNPRYRLSVYEQRHQHPSPSRQVQQICVGPPGRPISLLLCPG